jgi:hypothetical protein
MPAGPWATWPEILVSERLDAFMNANSAAVAAIRPPIPMIGQVAPRFGYRKRVLGIEDVVNVNQVFQGPNSDSSTQRPGYTGTSLPGWSNG